MGFNDVDDYILINMKNNDYYKQLVDLKGEENVGLRKAFLNVAEQNGLENKMKSVSANKETS